MMDKITPIELSEKFVTMPLIFFEIEKFRINETAIITTMLTNFPTILSTNNEQSTIQKV